MTVVGVLLAGGQSRRMGGGDKCLRPLGATTILAHVIARAAPQVEALALNANGDPSRFAEYQLPVVADSVPGYAGPLAGILAGLDWVAQRFTGDADVVSFATDAPFVPDDLVVRFLAAREQQGVDLVCASSGGRAHPVFGLWPVGLREELRAGMRDGVRKVDSWTARYRLVAVDFPVIPFDPFFNTNRPEDLTAAQSLIGASGS